MSTVISVENVSKSYCLGAIGGATLKEDLSRWWAKLLGKPDPSLRVGEEHHARRIGEQFWALRDVNFHVREGEVLGIIGRNGAGKSTLLKILSQVTSPTSGEIKIKGRIASLLEVGTGFHPELTGRENIFLNGAILGMTKAEIRGKFDEIVAFSGIEEFIDTPVKRYSSGMYVRLAFAVAAHLEPEILIVDEVLAVGDAEFQKKCLGKMQDVARNEGRTVLFVSHNLNAVTTLCRQALLIQGGRAVYHGPVAPAVQRYTNDARANDHLDLTEHSNRVAGHHAFFRRMRFFDAEGLPASSFAPHAEVNLLIDVHAAKLVRDPRLGVAFVNWKGERIFAVASYMGPARLPPLQGDATVAVRFSLPALFPGNYQLQIGAYDSSTTQAVDEIYGAGAIEIDNVNYLRMTDPSIPEMGQIMVRSEWMLVPAHCVKANEPSLSIASATVS